MQSIAEQVRDRLLVCPSSRKPLVFSADSRWLETEDGSSRYEIIAGVPHFLSSQDAASQYLKDESGKMVDEYVRPNSIWLTFKTRLINLIHFGGDYRSRASVRAVERTIDDTPEDQLCISVGGGPHRVHKRLVNINIGAFAHVDIVADAYALPYRDQSVGAVHCEAVLEHLEHPEQAVAEMYRVLKPRGKMYAATPFMTGFHGYPSHFQNFTLEGHRRLFTRAGFNILDSGTAVGPTFALFDFLAVFAREYIPTWFLSRAVSFGIRLVALPFKPLDRILNSRESSAVLASTTFILAERN